jgi:predicted metal-dependent phosphoesterase TrpH
MRVPVRGRLREIGCHRHCGQANRSIRKAIKPKGRAFVARMTHTAPPNFWDAPPVHGLPSIGHADLHVHPSGNTVSAETLTAVYAALRASDLQVAVLTDHDRVDVAQELVARSRDEGIPIKLVVGEEITTREGHLLGVGLAARVPAGLSLAATVAAVHEQGGIAVVAHPLLPTYIAASAHLLVELAEGDLCCRPDALEAMHPLAAWVPGWRRRVERLAQRCGYAVVGGSDAHVPRSVGRGRTCFHGDTEAALLAAIRGRKTWTGGRPYPIRDIFRRH